MYLEFIKCVLVRHWYSSQFHEFKTWIMSFAASYQVGGGQLGRGKLPRVNSLKEFLSVYAAVACDIDLVTFAIWRINANGTTSHEFMVLFSTSPVSPSKKCLLGEKLWDRNDKEHIKPALLFPSQLQKLDTALASSTETQMTFEWLQHFLFLVFLVSLQHLCRRPRADLLWGTQG